MSLTPLILMLLLLGGCKSEPPPALEAPEPVADVGMMTFDVSAEDAAEGLAEQHSFLWRVKGPRGPSWLFGTIHGGVKADWGHLPPDVKKAVEQAVTIVFETDPSDVTPSEMASALTLPRDASMRRALGEERFAKLVTYTGHPPETLDRYRPWVVHGELVSRWMPDEQPVDAWMLKHAQERKKRLDYLETIQDQVEALDAAITFEVLGRTIDNLDGEEQSMTRAVQSYRAGDVDGLRRNLFAPDDVADYQSMYDALFKTRNRAWLPEIRQHVERGGALIVVGAGHLIGPDNLVDLLRNEGYRVVESAYRSKESSFQTEDL